MKVVRRKEKFASKETRIIMSTERETELGGIMRITHRQEYRFQYVNIELANMLYYSNIAFLALQCSFISKFLIK